MQWHTLRQIYERESLRFARETEQEDLEWEFWKHARESDMWQHLRGKFEALADEERTILRAKPGGDCGLRAYCSYNSDMTSPESDLVRQGLVCLLYRSESGRWSLSEGPNEYFKARLEAVATRAGARLDAPRGVSPANYWLHCICVYLRRNESPSLFARSDTGGIITRVCESSATFCCWLEKRAIETLAFATERNTACGRLELDSTFEPPSAETSARVKGAKLAQEGVGSAEHLRDAILKKKARLASIERTLNIVCLGCDTPRRYLYGWEASGAYTNSAAASQWFCRSCARLRYASEGGRLRPGRYLRAYGNLPRPQPWFPYLFTSIHDPRLDEILRMKRGV